MRRPAGRRSTTKYSALSRWRAGWKAGPGAGSRGCTPRSRVFSTRWSGIDRSGKFILRIRNLDRQRFADFLPNGDDHDRLVKLVEFVTREQLAYDLELQMRPRDVKPMQLGADVRLGWNSFVTPEKARKLPAVRLQIRR